MPRVINLPDDTRRRGQAISMLALALMICASLYACGGPGRSVAAVCHVWDTQGLALHDRFEAAAQNERSHGAEGLLSGLASLIGAPNELSRLMSEMADVAPESAARDFESVAGAFEKLSESESKSLTNPLSALAGNLVNGLAVSGSLVRVNEFLGAHCGIPGHNGASS
jgi:hypothetical protein